MAIEISNNDERALFHVLEEASYELRDAGMGGLYAGLQTARDRDRHIDLYFALPEAKRTLAITKHVLGLSAGRDREFLGVFSRLPRDTQRVLCTDERIAAITPRDDFQPRSVSEPRTLDELFGVPRGFFVSLLPMLAEEVPPDVTQSRLRSLVQAGSSSGLKVLACLFPELVPAEQMVRRIVILGLGARYALDVLGSRLSEVGDPRLILSLVDKGDPSGDDYPELLQRLSDQVLSPEVCERIYMSFTGEACRDRRRGRSVSSDEALVRLYRMIPGRCRTSAIRERHRRARMSVRKGVLKSGVGRVHRWFGPVASLSLGLYVAAHYWFDWGVIAVWVGSAVALGMMKTFDLVFKRWILKH